MVSCGEDEFATMMERDGMLWRFLPSHRLQYQLLDSVEWLRASAVGNAFTCVCHHEDRLLCGTSGGFVVVYDLEANVLQCDFPVEEGAPIDQIYCASWPDKILVCVKDWLRFGSVVKHGTGDRFIFLPYPDKFNPKVKLDGRCVEARFNPDSCLLATDGNTIWRHTYGRKNERYAQFHPKAVTCMASQQCPVNPLVATGGEDCVVILWGVTLQGKHGSTGTFRRQYPVRSLVFLCTLPHVLVAAFTDPYVYLFDTNTLTSIIKTPAAEEIITMTATPSLNQLYCSTKFGDLLQLRLRLEKNSQETTIIDAFRNPIRGPDPAVPPCSCSTIEGYFLFAFSHGEVWIWESKTCTKLKPLCIWPLPHPQFLHNNTSNGPGPSYNAAFVDSQFVLASVETTAFVYDFQHNQLLSRVSMPSPALCVQSITSSVRCLRFLLHDASVGECIVSDQGHSVQYETLATQVAPPFATVLDFAHLEKDAFMVLFHCGLCLWRYK